MVIVDVLVKEKTNKKVVDDERKSIMEGPFQGWAWDESKNDTNEENKEEDLEEPFQPCISCKSSSSSPKG